MGRALRGDSTEVGCLAVLGSRSGPDGLIERASVCVPAVEVGTRSFVGVPRG